MLCTTYNQIFKTVYHICGEMYRETQLSDYISFVIQNCSNKWFAAYCIIICKSSKQCIPLSAVKCCEVPGSNLLQIIPIMICCILCMVRANITLIMGVLTVTTNFHTNVGCEHHSALLTVYNITPVVHEQNFFGARP